jgi:hypothetical protein
MPIEKFDGGTVITGKAIEFYRLTAVRAAVKLEGQGLRFTGAPSITSRWARQLGLGPRASRAKVLAVLDLKIELALRDMQKEDKL